MRRGEYFDRAIREHRIAGAVGAVLADESRQFSKGSLKERFFIPARAGVGVTI
jgi:hypothetical protein